MYKLKDVASRATAFAGAVFMLGGVVSMALPGIASADALNPLTERTLTLTSSSPGFKYFDGSGNSPSNPNAAGLNYSPPGSGPNGYKSGEKFSFRVSTDSSGAGPAIEGITFQYCTAAAGQCLAPGDAPAGTVLSPTPSSTVKATSSNLNVTFASPTCSTDATGDYSIYVEGVAQSCTDWVATATNKEDSSSTHKNTDNFITLKNTGTSAVKPGSGDKVEIVFRASETNYITNPGSGKFFVKINTFRDDTKTDPTDPADASSIIDGGVTVANVMTDSIQIQTKVLETMSFSVGTVNPDTLSVAQNAVHGPCDVISTNDDINLGDSNQEYSLATGEAYDATSYWRLSSNSSGGATVYYSGATLSNTVGDQIQAIGTTAKVSHPGMEQFGLAYTSAADTLDDNDPNGGGDSTKGLGIVQSIADDSGQPPESKQGYKTPTLAPLVAAGDTTNPDYPSGSISATNYSAGNGTINGATPTALFAFDPASLTSAVPFAGYANGVVDCSTGKMRYVANISPNTPAGVYTTKINYLAAPQY